MPAERIVFEPPDYEGLRQYLIDQGGAGTGLGLGKMRKDLQTDQNNDRELLKTKVFEKFFQQNNDTSRKKVLLVISGSHKDEEHRSQSYPNYLKAMAQSNPDCDFLVLNIDPEFTTNLSPEGIEIERNVDLKFLKGYLNPVKNPQFYSEIGNNLHRFDKVVFCSHTCPVGALNFHPLHRHCQKQGTDCITIGAYFKSCACCIIKKPLIKQDHVPFDFFHKINFFIDFTSFPKEGVQNNFLGSNEISVLSFVSNFLRDSDNLTDNNEYVATKKNENTHKSLELFTGIEDENFIKAIGDFINPERTKSLTAQSAIIGAGVGVIAGLTCVSALGLGIVSAPAIAIVAGTTIAGATAFYLINQEIQKNNHPKQKSLAQII